MDYTSARRNMVESQLRPNRVENPALVAAMLEVPRERFVPKSLQGVAYADEDLRLPDGRVLIEPLGLARLIETAAVQPSDLVLVIGCSTGYAGAVLARLAGTVIILQPDQAAVDQIETLYDELRIDNVAVTVGAAPTAGHPSQAPYDVILLAGSVEIVPDPLLEQLGPGGRLVAVVNQGRTGQGTLFQRVRDAVGRQVMFDARIAPLPGFAAPPRFVL